MEPGLDQPPLRGSLGGGSCGQLSGSHHSGSQPFWMQYRRSRSTSVGDGLTVGRGGRTVFVAVVDLVGVGSARSSDFFSVVRVGVRVGVTVAFCTGGGIWVGSVVVEGTTGLNVSDGVGELSSTTRTACG